MNIYWKVASKGNIPEGAIVAGYENNLNPLFLCRAKTGQGLYPGKVRLRFGAANIGWGGQEIKVEEYEVYCGGGKWVTASEGQIPDGAIVVGIEVTGAPVYAARAFLEGGLHPGQIRSGQGGALIPYGHKEHLLKVYEVLVEK
ncbi:MAG: DUF3421 domain-containing protein [Bacteroidia bacterium]